MLARQKDQIISLFRDALAPLVAGTGLQPNVVLERPRDPSHGDVACNIALQLAKPMKKNPRELAQALVAAVLANPARNGLIETVEIAGPATLGQNGNRSQPATVQMGSPMPGIQASSKVLAPKRSSQWNQRVLRSWANTCLALYPSA
jgi:hypothetical protein